MQFFYTKHFKKSVFFDKMLQIGSLLYAVFKQKKQQKLANEIDKYLVFSTENIQLILNKPIEYLTDFKQFTNNEKLNIELVFHFPMSYFIMVCQLSLAFILYCR